MSSPPFRDVIAVLTEPRRSRHSTLYLWFRRNHPQVVREIAANGVNWPDFAAALGRAGLRDRNGKVPSGGTAKQTWYRVRRELAARPEPGQPESAATGPSPPDARPHVRPEAPTATVASLPPVARVEVSRPKTTLVLKPARPISDERRSSDEPYDASNLPQPIKGV